VIRSLDPIPAPAGHAPGGNGRTLVDAHAHIHDCFDLGAFLDSAAANFAAASGGADARGVLLLTEGEGEDRFTELAGRARARRDGVGVPDAAAEWTFETTLEEHALLARKGARTLVLVGGRQVATSDGLEVLVFGTRERFLDGRPLLDVLGRARAMERPHAIPWGAGKWLFRRGRMLSGILASGPGSDFSLGDESGRPLFWPRVRHFEEARRRGIRVLRGTDPLPFVDEVARAGSFGFAIDGAIDLGRPMGWLETALRDPRVRLHDYGRLESPVPFVVHQWGMQRRKRARGRN
jgi:hypothetical protein